MKNFQAVGRFVVAATAAAIVATSPMPAAAAMRDPVPASKEDKPSAKYCISETLSGSRVPRKICKTKAEWQAEGFDPTK